MMFPMGAHHAGGHGGAEGAVVHGQQPRGRELVVRRQAVGPGMGGRAPPLASRGFLDDENSAKRSQQVS